MKNNLKPTKTGRIRAKQIFLTYANCELSAAEVHNQISLLTKRPLKPFQIQSLLIARELHQSEKPHIHVYLITSASIDLRLPHFYLNHPETKKVYKPHYERGTNHPALIEYVLKKVTKEQFESLNEHKDTVYISPDILTLLQEAVSKLDPETTFKLALTSQQALTSATSESPSLSKSDTFFQTLIQMAKDGQVNEALELLATHKPNIYLRSSKAIEQNLQYIWLKNSSKANLQFGLDQFILPPRL